MISVENVSASYGEKEILKLITLSVNSGDFIALIGPNGSGKSTLLKILAGQMKASKGCVLVDGKNMKNIMPKERSKKIAYFPQNRRIPDMDVATIVAHARFPRLGFGHILRQSDKEAVVQAIKQTGLEEFSNRPLSTLSGGERQKAYLAMLIAQDTKVLLLDEPGSFLDIRHQIGMMEILKSLNARGKTIIFAAHDLPLAFSYANRIFLIDKGNFIADLPTELMASSDFVEKVFQVKLKKSYGDCLFKYILAER